MSSLNTLTGRNGKFVVGTTLVARTKKWDVNPKLAGGSTWGDSDSAGYTNRAPGRKDCTFKVEGVYDTTHEQFDIFQPEDIALAVLWMNATALYWDFPRALCEDFSLAVDIDTEDVVGWSAGWGADGIFYRPGQSGATVRTLPTL